MLAHGWTIPFAVRTVRAHCAPAARPLRAHVATRAPLRVPAPWCSDGRRRQHPCGHFQRALHVWRCRYRTAGTNVATIHPAQCVAVSDDCRRDGGTDGPSEQTDDAGVDGGRRTNDDGRRDPCSRDPCCDIHRQRRRDSCGTRSSDLVAIDTSRRGAPLTVFTNARQARHAWPCANTTFTMVACAGQCSIAV